MHSSQMKTDGPAMIFLTSCWLLPQNEQYNNFSVEVVSLKGLAQFGLGTFVNDFINQAIFTRLLCRHKVIAIGIFCYRFD